MKRILFIFSIAAVMVACNTTTSADVVNAKLEAYKDSLKLAADTAGFSDFKDWKAQNELVNVQAYNQQMQYAAIGAAPANRSYTTARKTSRATTTRSRSTGTQSGAMNSESSNAAMRKKGWSKAAKGAAIGGGSGAVLGAVINKKNRVVGGVIGGVVGGAVGYGIGRGIDKRDGRY